MIEYIIKPIEGFSNKIGELVFMMEHVRAVTLSEISMLGENDLDFLADSSSNSIGALLMHIAAIESVHQVVSFENRDFNEKEMKEWGYALELGDQARKSIKGRSVDFYVEKLATAREKTMTMLKSKTDSWLYEEGKWGNGVSYNQYYLWFHVMEDEINHRGQIRRILRMLEDK